MDIFVPKFGPERYVRDGGPSFGVGLFGEYRYTLRGADGRVKQECDWTPNTLLDQGLSRAIINQSSADVKYGAIYFGDSATATDITQTSLQGSLVGTRYDSPAYSAQSAGVTATWERTCTATWTIDPGDATGTLSEFVLTDQGSFVHTNASVRVVFTTPIVKGAADELTLEHRFTWYWDNADQTGTLTITGDQDYDWTMRIANIDVAPTQHPNLVPPRSFRLHSFSTQTLPALTDYPNTSILSANIATDTHSWGGTLGTYYSQRNEIMGVDEHNGSIGLLWRPMEKGAGAPSSSFGVTTKFAATIGGGMLVKENTHELVISWRVYPQRYVP